MPAPMKSMRFPPALLTLVEAECTRSGRSFSDVVVDAVAQVLGGHKPEPAPAPPAPPRKPPAGARVAEVPRRSATVAGPAGAGRGARAMEAAGVMQYDPTQKRPQYQKGQGAPGKGGFRKGR